MRRIAAALALLLILSGCGGTDTEAETLLERFAAMESCAMEARVKCEYEGELRAYTLRCDYAAQGESRVTVLEPEALAGLSAVFDGEGCTLRYEELVLDAGTLGESALSPAEALPRLMEALRTGWLLEQSREEGAEGALTRLTLETEENGVKHDWTVWLREDGTPAAAETTVKEKLIFRMEFTSFSFGAILNAE